MRFVRSLRLTDWLLIALVLIGGLLRAYHYYEFPVGGETRDEYAWSFLGGSLLQTGVPASWSFFSVYPQWRSIELGAGAEFPLVRPVLDHPPLFSLLPGIMTTLTHVSWDQIHSMKLVRLPLVVVGFVNLLLAALWFRRIFSPRSAVLATALFATIPSFVFLSRVVVSENLLLTWTLLALLLAEYRPKGAPLATLLLHALMPLTKISGIAVAIGSIVWHWSEKKTTWRWAAAGLFLGIAAFLAYAAFYDFSLFLRVQAAQGGRDIGFLTLLSTQLLSSSLVAKMFPDSWSLLGFLALFAWIFLPTASDAPPRSFALAKSIGVTYILFLAFSVGEHTVHGWYRIVFWPIWIAAVVSIVETMLTQKNWMALALVWLMMLPVFRLGLLGILGFDHYSAWSVWVRLVVVFSAMHLVIVRLVSRKHMGILWQLSCGLLVLLVLAAHITTIVTMTPEHYWQDDFFLQSGIEP